MQSVPTCPASPSAPAAAAAMPPLPLSLPPPLPPPPPVESAFLSLSLVELRVICSTLLKRLHEASQDVQADLRRVLDLLRLLAQWPDSDHAKMLQREWLLQMMDAVLRRHYTADAGDCDVVVEVMQAGLALVCQHLTITTVQPMPPLPALSQFPPHLFDPPQPPASLQPSTLSTFPATIFSSAGSLAVTAGGALPSWSSASSSSLSSVSALSTPALVSRADSSSLSSSASSSTSSTSSPAAAAPSTSSSEPATATPSSAAPPSVTAPSPTQNSSELDTSSTSSSLSSSSSSSSTSSASTSSSSPPAASGAPLTPPSDSTAEPPAALPAPSASPSSSPESALITISSPSPSSDATATPSVSAPVSPTVALSSSSVPSTPTAASAHSTLAPTSALSPSVSPTSSTGSSPSTSKPTSQPSSPGLAMSRVMTPSTSLLHSRTPAPPCCYTPFLPCLHSLYPLPPRPPLGPSRLSLDPLYLDLLDLLLNDSHPFYTQHGHERPLPPLPNDVQDTPEWRRWNDALRPGQWVDVWLRGRWRPALILGESQGMREVQFEGPSTHESLNNQRREWLDGSAPVYAEAYSRSRFPLPQAQQWRYGLKEGSSLDALDTVQKYYTAKVLELRGDYIRISYDGWTSKYDETLSLYSDRLAPHRTKALGGKESSGVALTLERSIDDSADTMFPHELVRWRGKEWGTWYWCEVVNHFALLGGFPLLFHRLYTRQSSPLPVAQLRRIVSSISYCTLLFNKTLAQQYLPLCHFLAFATILDLTDVELRQLSKEHLEDVVKAVQRMLGRFHFPRHIQAFVDDFGLACAVKRLRCSVVERRVNGMGFIQDYIALLKRFPTLSSSSPLSSTSTTWLTSAQVLAYIEREHLLEDALSVSTGHHELMKRSVDILKFFASESALENRHLDLIWTALSWAMKRDDDVQLQTLYKLLDDLAWQLSSQHILHLFSLVESIPFAEYQLATLDLIKELTRWTNAKTGGTAAKRAMSLLWSCLQDGNGVSRDIAKAALGRIEEIIKSRSYRIEYLEAYGSMLQSKVSVITCIHLLTQIIESFPDAATPLEDKTKAGIISYLNDNFTLLDSFIDDLCAFKLEAQQLITAQHIQPAAINSTFISSFTSYLSHIKERLTFLHYLLSHSQGSISLTQRHMDTLWAQLNINAFTPAEREQFYRFLRQCVHRTNRVVLSDELSRHVFDALLLPSLQSPQALTLPHYLAFESFFFHVNYIHRKLNGSVEELTVTSPDFDLFGAECLWRIALECRVASVSSKAIALLNSLHENVSEDCSTALHVRSTYIANCIAHLSQYVRDTDWKRGQRCLQLLHNLLDNNEKKGVGRARSHACSTNGRRLRFLVQNNVKGKEGKRARVEVVAHANDTLFALRASIASALSLPLDSFRLITHGKPLTPDHFPLYLHQLPLRSGQTILVTRRAPPLAKADLLDGRGEPTPLFKAALGWIFGRFAGHKDAEGPYLSGADFASYILACGAGEQSAGEERIRQIFERHGEKVGVKEEAEEGPHVKMVEEVKEEEEVGQREGGGGGGGVGVGEGGPSVAELEAEREQEPAVWEKFLPSNDRPTWADSAVSGAVRMGGSKMVEAKKAREEVGRVEREVQEEGREEEDEGEKEKENRPVSVTAVRPKSKPPAILVNGELREHSQQPHDAIHPASTHPTSSSSSSSAAHLHHSAQPNGHTPPQAVLKEAEVQLTLPLSVGSDAEGETSEDAWLAIPDIDETSELWPLLTHLLFVFDPVFNLPQGSTHLPLPPGMSRFIDLPEWLAVLGAHSSPHLPAFQAFLTSLVAGDVSWPESPLTSIDWLALHGEVQEWEELAHYHHEPAREPLRNILRLIEVVISARRRLGGSEHIQEGGTDTVADAADSGHLQPLSPESVSSISPAVSFSPSVSPLPDVIPSSSPAPVPASTSPARSQWVLRLSGFVEFYREACIDRLEAVWNDLSCHGFRHDLRRDETFASEDAASAVDDAARAQQEAALPRNLIASHPHYFALFFQILGMQEREGGGELDELAQSTWNLLQRLSTQPALHEALLTLRPEPVQWEELLSSQSLYRLLYSLQVLDSLTEAIEDDEDEGERHRKQSQRDEWVDAFLSQGGFTHLYTILRNNPKLQSIGPVQEPEASFALRQKCLALLLRLLYHLLLSAMRVQKPELGGVARIAQQPHDDFISPSELEVEAKWVREEAEREEETNAPPFLTYMQHGPRQEHEQLVHPREERKEKEEKTADRPKEATPPTTRERTTVSVEEDDGSDGEEQAGTSRAPSPDTALLGCHMSLAQSSSILSSIDLHALHLRLYHYVLGCTLHFHYPITADGLALAEASLNTFIHLILYSPTTLLPSFYALLTEAPAHFFAVLYCSSSKLRRLFAHAMYQIGQHTPPVESVKQPHGALQPKPFLLSYLLTNFPPRPDLECSDYFELLCALIRDQINEEAAADAAASAASTTASQASPASPTSSPSSDSSASTSSSASSSSAPPTVWPRSLPSLFHLLCQHLLRYPSIEAESPAEVVPQDKVLYGILGLLHLLCLHRLDLRAEASRSLTSPSDPDLITLLFSWYLFGTPPKCRHPATRVLALALLEVVCQLPTNFDVLFDLLCRQFASLTQLQTFDYNPEKLVRSAAGHVGLRNLGSTCFPECDSRVLTDAGFLFLRQIEERLAAKEPVLYACYEVSTQSIVYRPGHIVYAAAPERWVDFTHADTRSDWSASSDDHGAIEPHTAESRAPASHITQRTTPEHDMYVQPATLRDAGQAEEGGDDSPRPFRKMTAAELSPGYACSCDADGLVCSHGYSAYRMFTGAAQGICKPVDALSLDDRAPDSPVVALRLQSAEQLSAFLELYGFWLGSGSMTRSRETGEVDALLLRRPKRRQSRVHLAGLLKRVRMRQGVDWTNRLSGSRRLVRIVAPLWCCYFDEQHGGQHPHWRRRREVKSDTACTVFPSWVRQRLGREQLRLLLEGLRQARAGFAAGAQQAEKVLYTSSSVFREQLMLVCLHAGYSAHFSVGARAHVGVNEWRVEYSESISELLHARDVRYDGGALRLRDEADGASARTLPADAYDEKRDGRVWCVHAQHDDHLIFVQRAHTDSQGHITQASRPVIAGNCYMNSLLQQLYMMPKFRYGVWLSSLQCPITRELREAEATARECRGEQLDTAALEKEKAVDVVEDELLHQLQVMFAFLSQSDKQFYDTAPFCFSYKDERGQPINVRVQQDAQEFFNVLLDRLEKRLMALPLPAPLASLSHLIQSSFGGTLVNQLVCHSCHHVRESPEPFYSLSLQVKNKTTMTDSLEQYVLGEVLSDFNCIAAGTLISMADGTSTPIEQVRKGMRVLSRGIGAGRGQRDALVSRPVVSAGQTGIRPCVELLFADGRTLLCTADHRILTAASEWVTAAELLVGETEVAVGVEYPRVGRVDDGAEWSLDLTESLGYALNSSDRLDAALAFARLLGYAFAGCDDGHSADSLRFSHALDAEACQADIELLTGMGGWGTSASIRAVEVPLPMQLVIALLAVGVKACQRMSGGAVCEVPAFVLDPQCPVSVVREFLGGFCGGTQHQRRPKGLKGLGLDFAVIRDGTGATVQLDQLRLQLLPLFGRVGVPGDGVITRIELVGLAKLSSEQGGQQQWRRESGAELDIRRSYALHVDFDASAVLPFARCVGFRYAHEQSIRLSAAAAHFRRIEQHHPLLILPEELSGEEGKLTSGAMQRTLKDMNSWRFFYSPVRRPAQRSSKRVRSRRARQAEKRLTSALHHDASGLPLWRVKLVGRRPAGELAVYDLSVPSEDGDDASASFVANGVLAHNCSACQQRVEITKRVCLGSLPSVMIIHLKRFELNYETFQHEKLNGRFVFPLDFNFAPYTKEGLALKEAEQKRKMAADAEPNKATTAAAPPSEDDSDDVDSPQDGPHSQAASPDVESVSTEYELVGILIHTGNSSSGHYYSFVKDRCIPPHHFPPPPAATGAPVWLEFNDNQIRPFDLAFLDEAAYGGEQEVTERTSWGNDVITQQEKVKNAYMLVFERKPKQPAQPLPAPHAHTNGHSPVPDAHSAPPSTAPASPLPASSLKEQSWLQPDLFFQPPSRVIPPLMLSSVQRDNVQFQRDRQIFNADHFNFLIAILRSYQPLPSPSPLSYHEVAVSAADTTLDPAPGEAQPVRLLKLCTMFAFNCLVRCSDNRGFTAYREQLLRLYELNVPACQWLLEYMQVRSSLITELMLACRDEHVRAGVMELLVLALRKVSVFEQDSLAQTVDVQTTAESKPTTPLSSPVLTAMVAASAPTSPQAKKLRVQAQLLSLTARYICAHIHQRVEVAKHWMRFSSYFQLLFEFAKLGTAQRHFLLQRQCVVLLCDLFLGECSPLYDRKGKKRPSIGNMIVQPDWSIVLDTLSILVRACRTETSPVCSSPSSPTCPFTSGSPDSESSGQRAHSPYFSGDPHANLTLSVDDLRMIRTKELYQLALMQAVNIQPMALLACHWCWESASFTDGIVDIVLTGLSKLDHAGNDKSYYQMMCELCAIHDSLRQQRWQRVLLGAKGLLQLLYQSRHTQAKRCFTGVQLLEHLSRNVEGFSQQLLAVRQDWHWMDAWLRDYVSRGKKHNFAGEQEREDTLWRYEDMLKAMGARVEAPAYATVALIGSSLTPALPAMAAAEVAARGKVLGPLSGIDGGLASAAAVEGDAGRARRASWSATGQSPLTNPAFEESGVLTGPMTVLTGTSTAARKGRGLNVSVAAGYADAKPILADAAGSRRAKRELNEERDERDDATADLAAAAKPRRTDKRRAKVDDASTATRSAASVDHDESIRHDEEPRTNPMNPISSTSSSSSSTAHRRNAPLSSFAASPSPGLGDADDDNDIYENDLEDSLPHTQQQRGGGGAGGGGGGGGGGDVSRLVNDDDEEGDEDDDELEDEAQPYPADDDSDDPAVQVRTRRTSRPQPSSPMRKGLTFDHSHSPTYEGRGVGKRRAPSTPVVGGGGGKGKGQPNSPASAGGGGGVGDCWLPEGGAGGAERACARCTFLNSASARVCDMCDAELG